MEADRLKLSSGKNVGGGISVFIYLILFLAFILMIFVSYEVRLVLRQEIMDDQQKNFDSGVIIYRNELVNDLKLIDNILFSIRGLFGSSETVTKAEFDKYVDTLRIYQEYPSLVTIGYLKSVPPDQLAAFEKEQRKVIPNFSVFPGGKFDENYVLIYEKPRQGVQSVIGFNPANDIVRKEILDSARDSGESRITPPIMSVSAPGKQAFLVVLPIYRNGAPIATVEERREALDGFAITLFLKDQMLSDLLGRATVGGTDLEIFGGADFNSKNLLFDTEPSSLEILSNNPATLSKKMTIPVLGQTWSLYFTYHPMQEFTMAQNVLPNMVFGFGVILALFILVLLLDLVGTQNRARSIAGKLTSDLSKFKLAVESSTSHIIITDTEGKIIYANKAVEKLTGYSINEVLGQNPRLWGGQMSRDFYQSMWHTIKDLKSPFRGELVNKRKNGELYNVLSTISPIIDEKNNLVGFVGLEEDITDRVKASKQLTESEKRYHSLFEFMLDGLAYCQMEYDDLGKPSDFKYLEVNKRFVDLTGLSGVVGKKVSEVIPGVRESNPELLEIYGRVAKTGNPEKFETYLDQLKTWFSISVYSYEQGYFVAIFANITEQKRLAEVIKENEERFRALIEKGSDVYSLVGTDGTVSYVSPTVERVLGYKAEYIQGKSAFMLVHPDDVEIAQAEFSKLMEEPGRSEVVPLRVKRANGEYIWLEVVGTNALNVDAVRAIIVNYRDVNDRKKAEEKLHEQALVLEEEKSRDEALIASIGDGLLATDADGTIIAFNKEAERLLKWSRTEAVGRKYYDLYKMYTAAGEQLKTEDRPIYRTLKNGELIHTSDYFYQRKDGSLIAVGLTTAPVVVGGRTVGMIDIFRDITREKEVDRMKTEFISLASHQLRTPLSAIKWFLEILLTDEVAGLSDKQKDALNNIDESNERMIVLVNSLLNISRLEAGRVVVEPEETDMTELVSGIISKHKREIDEKKQGILLAVEPNVPKIMIDAKLIGQVYENLLTNSIKYTQTGGSIAVDLSLDGDQLMSKVTDTGMGIPVEEQSRVFVKFFRGSNVVKTETEGTGLGVYLAKIIVEQSGGKIGFKSDGEGKGSTFWFTLPVAGMKAKEGEVGLENTKM